jgi:hypothetical protein
MVVHDFHFVRFAVDPPETNAILLVDTNAVLPPSFALEGFQLIAGGDPQLVQNSHGIELIEFASGHAPDLLRTRSTSLRRIPAVENILCAEALEGPDHS